jgi:hypothetical protein
VGSPVSDIGAEAEIAEVAHLLALAPHLDRQLADR